MTFRINFEDEKTRNGEIYYMGYEGPLTYMLVDNFNNNARAEHLRIYSHEVVPVPVAPVPTPSRPKLSLVK